jgi:dinuclear metal center YbgI/SA1388 family protein
MSLTLQVLTNYLEEFLQISLYSDYCPNGLQVEGRSSIKKLGFAVSASLETIEMAVKRNVDALVVHHGIFWNKDPYPLIGTKKKKIEMLLNYQISLLAYHLPLDAHMECGNNFKALKDIGFVNLKRFGDVGAGGSINEIGIDQLIKNLEAYYDHQAFLALGGKKRIQSAALISGGAHRSIEFAKKQNYDCFITGSFDEPVWHFAKEENINFIALGHFATEKVGVKALKEHLLERFGTQTEFLDCYNPF